MDDVAALAGELESAGVEYEIQVYYGAPHGFTEFSSDRYQKRADKLSWKAFSDFLATNLADLTLKERLRRPRPECYRHWASFLPCILRLNSTIQLDSPPPG